MARLGKVNKGQQGKARVAKRVLTSAAFGGMERVRVCVGERSLNAIITRVLGFYDPMSLL